jgi:hypothetical protein
MTVRLLDPGSGGPGRLARAVAGDQRTTSRPTYRPVALS